MSHTNVQIWFSIPLINMYWKVRLFPTLVGVCLEKYFYQRQSQ